MDTTNLVGEVLESAGTAAKQTGQAAASIVGGAVAATASQLGVPVVDNSGSANLDNTNTQDVVESLYGESQPQNTTPQQTPTPASDSSNAQSKSPEELANIEFIRKELHEAYYQTLVNPPKQEEESVSEKIEREDQQEMVDLQEKQMEKPPELVQRAAQRVEKFPGASG